MSDKVHPDKIKPGQDWVADLFQPRDAVGVVNLFQSVYGDGYPVPAFVDPAELIRANAERRIISSLARTAGGDIVGHNALFRSAPYDRMYESGAGVVHPGYRGSGIGHDLVFHGQEMARLQFGMDAIFGENVCNHLLGGNRDSGLGQSIMALDWGCRKPAAFPRISCRRDGILMQKLCHIPQWDHIQLLTDPAKRLLEYVRADYNRFCR